MLRRFPVQGSRRPLIVHPAPIFCAKRVHGVKPVQDLDHTSPSRGSMGASPCAGIARSRCTPRLDRLPGMVVGNVVNAASGSLPLVGRSAWRSCTNAGRTSHSVGILSSAAETHCLDNHGTIQIRQPSNPGRIPAHRYDDKSMNTTRRYLAFDIETARITDNASDWRSHRPLGISCAATLAADADPGSSGTAVTGNPKPGRSRRPGPLPGRPVEMATLSSPGTGSASTSTSSPRSPGCLSSAAAWHSPTWT